jgi:hypothetical protein
VRISTDSHGSLASPALITYKNSPFSEALLLAWCGSDGTIYMATGMDQTGTISPTIVRSGGETPISTYKRFALVEFPSGSGLVSICYTSSLDNTAWYSSSAFPYLVDFPEPQQLDPHEVVSGQALSVQGEMVGAASVFTDHQVMWGSSTSGFSSLRYNSFSGTTTFYTPALGVTPGGIAQLAFADQGDSNRVLVFNDPFSLSTVTIVTSYPDECVDGPALVTTVDGYAAAYVDTLTNNIVLLYGVENNDPKSANQVILHDASPYTPAVATLNGVTYVAWIGTEPSSAGTLFFADLASMPVVSPPCPVGEMIAKRPGSAASELGARLRQLRDTLLDSEASGRWLNALLRQHSPELVRLFESHQDLSEKAWDLVQQVEPISTGNTPFTDDVIAAGEDVLRRVNALASASLQDSIRGVSQLVSSLRGRTLAEGLTSASRTRHRS